MVVRFLPTSETPARAVLEPAATPAPRPPQNRVAVLPFVNKTGDPGNGPAGSFPGGESVENGRERARRGSGADDHSRLGPGIQIGADSESAVVEAVNAGVAVSGSIFAEGDGLRVQAVVRDIVSGHLRPPAEAVCPAVETSDCLDRLAVRVAEIVELQVHEPDLLLMLNRLPSYEAYRAVAVDNDEERGVALDPAIGILRRLYQGVLHLLNQWRVGRSRRRRPGSARRSPQPAVGERRE